jgi:hypothetical protein
MAGNTGHGLRRQQWLEKSSHETITCKYLSSERRLCGEFDWITIEFDLILLAVKNTEITICVTPSLDHATEAQRGSRDIALHFI